VPTETARSSTNLVAFPALRLPQSRRDGKGLFGSPQWPAYFFFPHRFAAAFAAICDRFAGGSAAARATPPFRPPRRPKATAWGFFVGSAGFGGPPGTVFGASPMDSRNTWWASWFGSRGLGMLVRLSQVERTGQA
jgi:hypothetical protein